MTRLSLESSIPLHPLDASSASGSVSEAAAGSPGSFNDVLHQATEAANAAPGKQPGVPARTASPETQPAAASSRNASSPPSDQSNASRRSSPSRSRATADTSPSNGNASEAPSDKTADKSLATGQDASRWTASATSQAAGGTQSPATGSQAAAVPATPSPTSPAGTPDAKAGNDQGAAAKADRGSDCNQSLAATANTAKTAAVAGVPSPAPKKAGAKPADATRKTALAASAKDLAAATTPSATEASGPLPPSQDAAARVATAGAQQAAAQDGGPQTSTEAGLAGAGTPGAQAAAVGTPAGSNPLAGTTGAAQPAGGGVAPSATESLAGQPESAAGNASSNPHQHVRRAAGESAVEGRGSTVESPVAGSDVPTAESGGTVESAAVSPARDPKNPSGNASPVGTTLTQAAAFDLPAPAEAAKSGALPAAARSNESPVAAQAQGSSTPIAPAAGAAGQATSGASQADQVRLVQRVAAAFQALGGGGGTVRLRLSPPELGAVKVEVNVQNGVMNAHLETETSAARSLLLDNLPALRDRLAQQQIKVERFDVDLAGHSSGGMPQGANQQAQQQSQPYSTARQTRSGGQQAADSVSALPAVRTAARGRFDVTI
jgi:flagellar hook-length control protein FliK